MKARGACLPAEPVGFNGAASVKRRKSPSAVKISTIQYAKLQWGRLCEEAEIVAFTTAFIVRLCGRVFERFVFPGFPWEVHRLHFTHNYLHVNRFERRPVFQNHWTARNGFHTTCTLAGGA